MRAVVASVSDLVPPPVGPAPVLPAGGLGPLRALWDIVPRAGEVGRPALAILLTSALLLATLALYIGVCVAVFALF